jgi:cytochrome c-type biogenesis protein CcmE
MNQKDYVQAEAVRILNTKGHCISELVARAVVAYAGDNYIPKAVNNAGETQKQPEKHENTYQTITSGSAVKTKGNMTSMLGGLGDLLPVKKP